ncbi:steroid receptor-associated and regulated protein [Saccopteryx bilineata]|uniref:steroid receptor-associated and regulated protein n=1 Tax=Saccopteryx bilineata TaxID=59482 RepID=UPI00338D61CC
MASSKDPRHQRASPQVRCLETDLDTSSGGKLDHHQKAIHTAHLTFVIDCAHGTQPFLAAQPALPHAPCPNLGCIIPPMKTYIFFRGDNQPHPPQEAPLGGGRLTQARGTLPPCKGTVAPTSYLVSPLHPQGAPEAKGSPMKMVPTRSSAWGVVMGSLKALSSCVCGQAD